MGVWYTQSILFKMKYDIRYIFANKTIYYRPFKKAVCGHLDFRHYKVFMGGTKFTVSLIRQETWRQQLWQLAIDLD